MRHALLILLLNSLAGCVSIMGHTPPPADWPELRVVERKASFMETQRECGFHPLAAVVVQCLGVAKVDFCERTCTITYATDLVLEHERLHCKGHDHIDSFYLRDLWESYKRMHGEAWCEFHNRGPYGKAKNSRRE